MNAPAAISASLVNMRNVGTHKSVALTLHVPEEQAQQIIEVFGWATMAAPVPVALARLVETPVSRTGQDGEVPLSESEGSRPAASPSASKKVWADMPPSQQAALRCTEPGFQSWLGRDSEAGAASEVRRSCCVVSRRDLDSNHKARVLWYSLETDYLVATGKMAAPR